MANVLKLLKMHVQCNAMNILFHQNTIKTNYGKFNIHFAAVKVWNHLDESIKHLPLKTFKNKVKLNILQSYCS